MRELPAMKLYKECPECRTWAFGQYDRYCPRCGKALTDHEEWLAGIGDYAASLLIEYLERYPDLAKEADIYEIPDYATEGIRANGNVLFNQAATRHVLAECWNEVESTRGDKVSETTGGKPADLIFR